MVVTRPDWRERGRTVQPGNREWATAIACISVDGFDVPPFLLVKGVCHLANWYLEGGRPGLLSCVDVKVCKNASQTAWLIVSMSDIPPAERLTVLVLVRIDVCILYPMPRVFDIRLDQSF